MRRSLPSLLLATLAVALLAPPPARAQAGGEADPPGLADLVDFAERQSALRVAVERYAEDRAALFRRHDVPYAERRRERLRRFYAGWREQLRGLDFTALDPEGQVDWVLLRNQLDFELEMLDQEEAAAREMAPLVPFAPRIAALQEARRDREDVDARATADVLDALADEVAELTAELRANALAVADVPGVVAEPPPSTSRRCAAPSGAGTDSTTATTPSSRGGPPSRTGVSTGRSRLTRRRCATASSARAGRSSATRSARRACAPTWRAR